MSELLQKLLDDAIALRKSTQEPHLECALSDAIRAITTAAAWQRRIDAKRSAHADGLSLDEIDRLQAQVLTERERRDREIDPEFYDVARGEP